MVQSEAMVKDTTNTNITAEIMEDDHKNSSQLYLEKVFIKQDHKIIPIKRRNIFFIKSRGNYLVVYIL